MLDRMRSVGMITGAALLMLLTAGTCLGAIDVVDNTSSGYYQFPGFYDPGNTNYFAGFALGQSAPFDNYFVFDLTGVSGTVSSATLHVDTYSISGSAPFDVNGGTYAVYATSLSPSEVGTTYGLYSDLTSGPQIGSIVLALSDSFKTASIMLNSAGLAFLTANEGNGVVIGGSLVSATGGSDYAFAGSSFTPSNNLTISTAVSPSPEPAFFLPLGVGIGLAIVVSRRCRKSA